MARRSSALAQGPGGYALMLAVALTPMVFVAYRRHAGFNTYWRMPPHIFGSAIIFVVVSRPQTGAGCKRTRQTKRLCAGRLRT